ncbi:DUF499 domain-containing protein [Candidatus Poriferisodalis sp.]|uniref:DUF499 domain-containing protein n=1 Tax=Candidatus Poriferisodalis sp. TaxID=3101277 RepID=UPI003D13E294
MSNRARVGDAFGILAQCLKPFVDRHMARGPNGGADWAARFAATARPPVGEYSVDDPLFLLRVIADCWRGTFERQLPRSARNIVFTLRDKRNDWAHNKRFQLHDTQYTLSGILTLIEAVAPAEAPKVQAMLYDLNRIQYERAQTQDSEEKKGAVFNVLDSAPSGLKPWREVIHPHDDIHSGRFSVAEFAADLEMVRQGLGSEEYADPRRFFERTYLTAGLRDLLTLAVNRVSGRGGQPVISCQTNFGGGKTHSLIALYHLMSGIDLSQMPPELADLVREAGVDTLPEVNCAVVVGNRFGAGEVHTKPDGTKVNTIWGEIAWQLGGTAAYELVAESDRNRTNPGEAIRDVLTVCSPCLVLIDEWVAYARELYERTDLPGGSFDSQFSFAQTLSEATKATDGALFVVSIPASEEADADDENFAASSLEVGGTAGREALRRLTNVTNRLAETWQPASGDETYEIVRRRLFKPLADDASVHRDEAAEALGRLYRSQRADFPAECSEIAYVERIKSAYPIHPEVFDRLYQDWSSIDRFQRTRGVLRLMAATIDSLWASDDKSPLILPCSIPLGDDRVVNELAGRLADYWHPVIAADVDGQESHAARIDRATPHLGALHATRRVARTIFIGATPRVGSPNQGLEMRRVRLGATFAGDPSGPISDALSRLAAEAPYLYVDRDRYWFDRQQNVTRTARDEIENLLEGDRYEVQVEIVRRLRERGGRRGEHSDAFASVHVAPASGTDVADEPRARLVVLEPGSTLTLNSDDSPALSAAREILEQRGAGPRQYRNMLVFAAPEQRAAEALEQAAAEYLAWDGICGRHEELNLDAQQKKLAETQRDRSDQTAGLRIAEAYRYLLVPQQEEPRGPVTLEVVKLDSDNSVGERSGRRRTNDHLLSGTPPVVRMAESAARRLVNDGELGVQFPPVILRQELDGVLASRWADGHVAVSVLWEDMARYVYLPRLRDQDVLMSTAASGPEGFAWTTEGFATAVSYDDTASRYLGLSTPGERAEVLTPSTLIVRPDLATAQQQRDREAVATDGTERSGGGVGVTEDGDGSATSGDSLFPSDADGDDGESGISTDPPRPTLSVFRGSIVLDPERPTRAFTQVSDEVLTHVLNHPDAEVVVRVDVEVRKPGGFTSDVIRNVNENTRVLGFEEGTGFTSD